MFKSHKYTENYVRFNLSCKERSMLTKFRMGGLPINIEVGRSKIKDSVIIVLLK